MAKVMASPRIVVVSASQMPLANKAGFATACEATTRNTLEIPSTVPSSPSNGEITEINLSSVIDRFTFRKCLWNRKASSARRSSCPWQADTTASENIRINGFPACLPASASSRKGSPPSLAMWRRNTHPTQDKYTAFLAHK